LKEHFRRIALISPPLHLADPLANAKEIIKAAKKADSNLACVSVFPELSLTGYTCQDLFLAQDLLEQSYKALENVVEATLKISSIMVIGMPFYQQNRLYNVAVMIHKGRICGIVAKTFLPQYAEFYEKRWFSPSPRESVEVTLAGQKVMLGNDLLFSSGAGFSFSIDICEDFWTPVPPSHKNCEADIVLNLSASPTVLGKQNLRRQLVEVASIKLNSAYLYVNAGPMESSSDLVFDGDAFAYELGEAISTDHAEGFVIADVDIFRIRALRRKESAWSMHEEAASSQRIWIEQSINDFPEPMRTFSRHPYIAHVPKSEVSEVLTLQTMALSRRLKAMNTKKVVLGLSGGVDSTLALLVAVEAKAEIIGVSLPALATSQKTRDLTKGLADLLKIDLLEIDINTLCQDALKLMEHKSKDVVYENIQARLRTSILLSIANKHNALMLGTSDLSEIALGWSTYGGDQVSMYNPNCGVPKTLAKMILEDYQQKHSNLKSVLSQVLERPVSPELLSDQQKTEAILGPYEVHDFFIYHYLRYGSGRDRLLWLALRCFPEFKEAELQKYLDIFMSRFKSSQFKRQSMPDGPKVLSITLSPRSDWRMPADLGA
jgi:NAD+ synthase (glutamine-hydrolysing)